MCVRAVALGLPPHGLSGRVPSLFTAERPRRLPGARLRRPPAAMALGLRPAVRLSRGSCRGTARASVPRRPCAHPPSTPGPEPRQPSPPPAGSQGPFPAGAAPAAPAPLAAPAGADLLRLGGPSLSPELERCLLRPRPINGIKRPAVPGPGRSHSGGGPGVPGPHTRAFPAECRAAPRGAARAPAAVPRPVMDVWTAASRGLLWARPPELCAASLRAHVPGLGARAHAGDPGRPAGRAPPVPGFPRARPPRFPARHVRGSRSPASARPALSCAAGGSLWPDSRRPRR